MDVRQELRASDGDRQQVVERLSVALEDGRLQMDEFLDRIGLAYAAVTEGELVALQADLPAAPRRQPEPEPEPLPVAAARTVTGVRGALAELPAVLRVAWTIWLMAVLVNVTVWVLLTVTSGHPPYPWPLWVAGPWGAALLAISAGATQLRRARRAARRRPAGSVAA
jgi:hypothetical protein